MKRKKHKWTNHFHFRERKNDEKELIVVKEDTEEIDGERKYVIERRKDRQTTQKRDLM